MPREVATLRTVDRLTADNLYRIRTSDGFIVAVRKEPGHSSTFFVNQLRKRLETARRVRHFKLGHAGTLDPFADGVLVLLGGRATVLQDQLMRGPKTYEADVRFGATSPSFDPDTDITVQDPDFVVDPAALEAVLPKFTGEIAQVPPAFSAKHIDGQRAYQLARRGEEVVLEPRQVRIDQLELISSAGNTARIRVVCGPGTYIRSLARDLATELNTVGMLSSLIRTESGGFSIDECLTLRQLLEATGTGTEGRRKIERSGPTDQNIRSVSDSNGPTA